MQRKIYGFFTSQALYAAVRLEIPDLLVDGPRSVSALAGVTGAHEPSLHRLLRALVFLDVLREPERGTFALAEQGELLRSGITGSLRQLVLLLCGPECWASWGELEHSVRTGDVAWEHVFGQSSFDYLAAHPEKRAVFDAAMSDGASSFVPGLLSVCDFSSFSTVVDVGGGSGALLAGILATNPGLHGTVFDTADGLEQAPAVLAAAGVSTRCRLVPGDFFASVPSGADAYLLKSVLHDWDDERGVDILTKCREAMPEHAVLFLIEPLLPVTANGGASHLQLFMSDLNMMVCHGGRERTPHEFRTLLSAAGLRLSSVTPCPPPSVVAVLEARVA